MAEEKTAVIKEAKPYYALEDRFPLVETSLLGLQHMLAQQWTFYELTLVLAVYICYRRAVLLFKNLIPRDSLLLERY